VKLADVQAQLFEWVAGAHDIPEEDAAAIVDAGALEPSTRVGIYAEMYWLRMRDTLRDDFPKVVKAVGDEAFDALVATYLRVHPSTHYSMGQLGHGFAQSLEDPALASIASLEWARGQAFIAPDGPVLEPSRLALINEQTFAQMSLAPTASLRLVDRTVVWRRGFEVFHVEVSAAEARALTSLLNGAGGLPTLCEPFDEPAAAFTAIASWVNEGMIASLEINE